MKYSVITKRNDNWKPVAICDDETDAFLFARAIATPGPDEPAVFVGLVVKGKEVFSVIIGHQDYAAEWRKKKNAFLAEEKILASDRKLRREFARRWAATQTGEIVRNAELMDDAVFRKAFYGSPVDLRTAEKRAGELGFALTERQTSEKAVAA
jgi:hypothetical protein